MHVSHLCLVLIAAIACVTPNPGRGSPVKGVEGFGQALAVAGDVDRDGEPDLFVSTTKRPVDGNAAPQGAVSLISGRSRRVMHQIDPDATSRGFGWSMVVVPSTDGRSHGVLSIGAPFGGAHGSGVVVLAAVDSGAEVGRLEAERDGHCLGHAQFGMTLASAGDWNGDGVNDLVVGAPADDQDGDASGSVCVFSGSDRTLLWRKTGTSGDRLGSSVFGCATAAGNGARDLLVGAEGGGYVVRFTRDGRERYALRAEADDPRLFGSSVCEIGDVDGDGVRDVACGSSFGPIRLYSGRQGNHLYSVAAPYDERYSVADFTDAIVDVGDCDGDQIPDLAVGLQYGQFLIREHRYFGGVALLSGKDGAVVRSIVERDRPNSGLGYAIIHVDGTSSASPGMLVISAPGEEYAQPRQAVVGSVVTASLPALRTRALEAAR
ncbi:MAG: hypothetical protein K8S98_02160 [Planctomycetes bacterium]|nr:hypothetical protein [Planctomycetota bacterium]